MSTTRILIVEDDALVAEDIQLRLEDLGYQVAAVTGSGEKAVSLAKWLHPDLVLMDIVLEGVMDGITAASRIAQECDIPVVYLTSYGSDELLARASVTEPFGYILKPYTPRELHAVISIALYKAGIDRQLREQASFFESVAAISDAVLVLDRGGRLSWCNDASQNFFRLPRHQVIGKCPDEILVSRNGDDIKQIPALVEHAIASGPDHHEASITLLDARGDVVSVSCRVSPLRNRAGEIAGATVMLINIGELMRLSTIDHLTGLPNRKLLCDRLDHAIERARRENGSLAVMFLDLDRFKPINDTLGHAVGDALLKEVARRLKVAVRERDTVARLGGDEFVVMVEAFNDVQDLAVLAEKLRHAFAAPFRVNDYELHVSLSIGISIFPVDGDSAGRLFRSADTAMYRAKEAGRNDYQFFSRSLTTAACERLALEASLRLAIERGELILFYQPMVEMQSGRLMGVEALIRWRHPQLGLLTPDRFITVAEDAGLITPIGEWVLRTACEQMRQWRQHGEAPARIAVNISGYHFQRVQLLEVVKCVIQEAAIPPHCLELEFTESFIMQPNNCAIDVLRDLSALGVTISIDDFGTGFSSVSYLCRLPVASLKIDKSFVMRLPQDNEAVAITSAILAMAQSLGIPVVAEGIERQEQQKSLAAQGCQYGQGYLFAPPLDIDALNARFLPGRAV